MSFKKAFARRLQGNRYLIHEWTDKGYEKIEWINKAYIECSEVDATHTGLNGESLKKHQIGGLKIQNSTSMICLLIKNS